MYPVSHAMLRYYLLFNSASVVFNLLMMVIDPGMLRRFVLRRIIKIFSTGYRCLRSTL